MQDMNYETKNGKFSPSGRYAIPFFVILAVEAVLLVSLKHSKCCAIFVVFTHTTLTL